MPLQVHSTDKGQGKWEDPNINKSPLLFIRRTADQKENVVQENTKQNLGDALKFQLSPNLLLKL